MSLLNLQVIQSSFVQNACFRFFSNRTMLTIFFFLGFSSLSNANEPPILIESYVQKRPKDANFYIDYMVRTLNETLPIYGEKLTQNIEKHLSSSAGTAVVPQKLMNQVEEGRRHFIEGEYARAIDQLEDARTKFLENVATLASDQSFRESLHKALLFLGHAYFRNKQREKATECVKEAIITFPDRKLSLVRYGPELVSFYKNVRKDLGRRPRGSLSVTTVPDRCSVFVNERFVGMSPAHIADLYPGKYRVYVQQPGKIGRIHHVHIDGKKNININFGLDHVLRSDEFNGFVFDDPQSANEKRAEYASILGRSVGASLVLVMGFKKYQGRMTLLGIAVSSSSGKVLRSGMVLIEPAPPSPETLKSLGEYLVAGKSTAGDTVILPFGSEARLLGSTIKAKSSPTKTRSWQILKWSAAALAGLSLATGITLIALDGKGTCDTEDMACPESYQTLTPGITLTAIGGAAALASAVFFYMDYKTPKPENLRATIVPLGGQLRGIAFFAQGSF